MPFGMSNSGATLARGMRKLLVGLDEVDSYMNDLLVHSCDWKSHFNRGSQKNGGGKSEDSTI